MTDLPAARRLHRHDAAAASGAGAPAGRVVLGYEDRFLRRKQLVTEAGDAFLVDLAETVSLDDGDLLELEDGRLIAVAAAAEPLLEVRGDLARLAWHIGNRHTPCEMRPDWLVIRRDPVLANMLARLGAEVLETEGPFRPEGGAYGHGRTMGHAHGPAGADEGHGHAHGEHAHEHHGHEHHGHVHHHASTGPAGEAAGEPDEEADPDVLR